MKWTNKQEEAIYEKGKNILVAAAAGSGKTAVLVERIINKVINENVDIDNILIVTFTNAAASEMREKILNAIYKQIENDPYNERLQKQITLLGKANICTIDSFCLDIVRNNFYELDNISPNFRIGDNTEIELLKQEVIEEIFEEKYENNDKDFMTLIHTYTSYKDDDPLKQIVLKIFTYIQSNPFPEEWLKEKVEMFNLEGKLDTNFSETIWGKSIIQLIEETLIDDILKLENASKKIFMNPDLVDYNKILQVDISILQNFKDNLGNWDKALQIFQNIEFPRWSGKKIDNQSKDEAKAIRDKVKENYTRKDSKLKNILLFTSREANEDMYEMYKILLKLQNLILEFGKKFGEEKREKNLVDFNDIEHFALQLLIERDEEGKAKRSEIAKQYQKKFAEVAIDEYQDSNMVQEYILTSVSSNRNIFMVGDVKQSIYKFRQAMPTLFFDKYNKYKTKENLEKEDNLKVQLFTNFRSRDNILAFTNIIFQNIMSSILGEMEYDESEFLNYGAKYKHIEQDLKTEINIINMCDESEENMDFEEEQEETENEDEKFIEKAEIEAKFVANKVQELIDKKVQVYDIKEEKFRDIKYKDIVILLRSTSSLASVYEQELIQKQIPVFSDTSSKYLDSIEIKTIISLLKIIDNPIQDIPLVTVLRSKIGGFNDNDLVQIRLADKYDNFYNCLLKAKIQVDSELKKKIEMFLNNIETWRKEQEFLALDEFIWKIYSDTGFYNYCGLMPNGALRQANLKMLFQMAKNYETASFKGLYNFIKFVERLQLTSNDMNSAKIIGENDDVVRIMSIHKSKGLEFPVVFLSSTAKQFNLTDLNDDIILNQEMGIGAKYINYDMQIKYDTLSRIAIKNKMLTENLSEEMRILYVALTRSKEKLIITGTLKNYEKELKKMKEQIEIYGQSSKKINPVLIKKYKRYIDWIMLVYLYNKKEMENISSFNILNKKQILKSNQIKEEKNSLEKLTKEIDSRKPHEKEQKMIQEKLDYEYPYIIETTIPTKTSVSAIKEMKMEFKEKVSESENGNNQEFKEPKFLNNEQKLTPAKIGSVVHLCMQKLDINKNYTIEEVNNLIEDLVSRQIITKQEAEAVNQEKILAFTNTEIWKELKQAKEIQKEKPFYINMSAKEIYEKEIDDKILVQGIIDLYYINKNDNLILLDYKTDNIKKGQENILITRYHDQLELYKKALEKALNKKVKKTYIYSVALEKAIEDMGTAPESLLLQPKSEEKGTG